MSLINIMLVDDHTLFRQGLRLLLSSKGNINIVGEAADPFECLEVLDDLSVDIIISDINMPSKNGFDLLTAVKKQYPNIKVILLTYNSDTDYMVRAVDSKVDGYLTKSVDIDELLLCITKVMSGEQYIQNIFDTALAMLEQGRNRDKALIEGLTKREIEILKQIAGGRFNKEIADSLDITERTVKNHISNLFKKIGVEDRTKAAVFAIKNNLVNLY